MAAKRCTNFIASLSLNLANKAKDNQKKTNQNSLKPYPHSRQKSWNFLREAYQHRQDTQGRQFSVNIGFMVALRLWQYADCLSRNQKWGGENWTLPTAFGGRSTISGLGPVVHPDNDYLAETTGQKALAAPCRNF